MTVVYEGDTADEVWRGALADFEKGACAVGCSSRNGSTREILNAFFVIKDPTQRWVGSRLPAINPAFALAEVIWLLQGRDDSKFINCWNPALPRYCGESSTCAGAYGCRLRSQHGFDQLERAYRALSSASESRQVLLQIWDARSDFPAADGTPAAPDVPCNICSLLKVRNGRLEWTQILRSNDLFRGVPYNFVQFTCLQEVMAGWLGLDLGSYCHLSNSLHLYEGDSRVLTRSATSRSTRSVGSLRLDWQMSHEALGAIEVLMDAMISGKIAGRSLYDTVLAASLPTAYRDILVTISADFLRRRGEASLAEKLMLNCENPAYTLLWKSWIERFLG